MIPFPNKRYNIIYADPPWSYNVWSEKSKGRSVMQHYDVMSKKDILELPVPFICEDNCVLFLWATEPCLPQALELMSHWGFEYKTFAFTWVKRCRVSTDKFFMGLGHWTRSNPEMCLLGTRGSIKRVSKSVRELIDSPLREHSRKPDEARDRIVELVGDLPRIELFARQQFPGWDAWGNEIATYPPPAENNADNG